jgi:hypothetical protein
MLDTRSAGNRDLSDAKSLRDEVESRLREPSAQGPIVLKFRAAENVKAVTSPEGLVLLHVRKGVFFRANLVGARIWANLSDGCSIARIVSGVAEEFDAPCDVVAKDVHEFIASLVDQGFLEKQESRS